MEIIYVDSLFLLNFIIDYLLLLLTFRLCGLELRRLRCVFGALLGGAYAVGCFLPGLGLLTSPVCKLALWGLISLVTFGGEEHLFKCALSFLTISAVFGGGVWAASMLVGGGDMLMGAVRIELRTLIFSFAACYAMLSLALSRRMKLTAREIVSVRIVLRGRSVEMAALRDTGNSLRESVSGKRVLVAGISALRTLFSEEEVRSLSKADGASALLELSKIEGAPRFRPVIYSALGTAAAIIPAFTPDELYINGQRESSLSAAVSPTPIGGEDFSAII